MFKYYFTTEKSEPKFYQLTGNNITIHIELQEKEACTLFEKIIVNTINEIKAEKNNFVLILEDGTNITIDYALFNTKSNVYMEYLQELHSKIKFYQESKALKKVQAQGIKPTINRTRNSRMPKVLMASALSALVLISAYKVKHGGVDIKSQPAMDDLSGISISEAEDYDEQIHDIYKSKDIKPNFDDEIELTLPKMDISEPFDSTLETKKEEVKEISLDYEFDDWTDQGKIEDVYAYCGEYIDYYCERWGLPRDLILAQISQESPNPDLSGRIDNPCQLTRKFFVGETFTVPVYDENGFTGTYDVFTCTAENFNTPEGNVMAALAFDRKCIDYTDSIVTGIYLYNQGDPSFGAACKYNGIDKETLKGDEHAQEACKLVGDYNRLKHGSSYGDYNYITHILRYLKGENRGSIDVTCYVNGKKVKLTFNNTLELTNNTKNSFANDDNIEYNNELTR